MADSWVALANGALSLLGKELIVSLDDALETARVMKAQLPLACDAVLRDHPWNCAMVLAALPAEAGAPPHTFGYAYALPTDPWCLRIWTIEGGDDAPWTVAGRRIYTDLSPPLAITYVARITDPQLIDAMLGEAIATRLAANTAYRLTGSGALAQELWQKYRRDMLPAARSADGQEGGRSAPRSDFLEARF